MRCTLEEQSIRSYPHRPAPSAGWCTTNRPKNLWRLRKRFPLNKADEWPGAASLFRLPSAVPGASTGRQRCHRCTSPVPSGALRKADGVGVRGGEANEAFPPTGAGPRGVVMVTSSWPSRDCHTGRLPPRGERAASTKTQAQARLDHELELLLQQLKAQAPMPSAAHITGKPFQAFCGSCFEIGPRFPRRGRPGGPPQRATRTLTRRPLGICARSRALGNSMRRLTGQFWAHTSPSLALSPHSFFRQIPSGEGWW